MENKMFSRKQLNKLLKRYGYEITKLDKFKELLIHEYNNSRDFFFMQIGANDGVKFDALHSFVTSRKCKGIVVEPLKIYFENLKKNYSAYPNILPINCAVHRTKKKAILHYVDPEKLDSLPEWAEGIGSLDPNHHKKSGLPSECLISEEVECVHLMEIIREQKITHINLLQIDVEGYDGEVIRMIDFNIIKPKIIKYEHASLEKKERKDVIQLLNSYRYDVFTKGMDSIAVHTPNTDEYRP